MNCSPELHVVVFCILMVLVATMCRATRRYYYPAIAYVALPKFLYSDSNVLNNAGF